MEKKAEKSMGPTDLLSAMTLKMEEAEEKQTELQALLLALTGSLGTSELSRPQVDTLLSTCQRVSADALQILKRAGR